MFGAARRLFSTAARVRNAALKNLSYLQGPTTPPLLDMTIPSMFSQIVHKHGDREALLSLHQNTRLTYHALNELVEKTAANLLDLGLEFGDRVGIWSPNSWEWIVMQFATARAGLVLVNINPAYKAKELQHALNKVQCKALVMAPSFKTSDFVKTLREIEHPAHLKHIVCTDHNHRDGMLRFSDLCHTKGSVAQKERLHQIARLQTPHDAINIQFTSGTTGLPKGATLSHHNILNNGYMVGETLRYTCNDKVVVPVPMYHCFGMVMALLAIISHGGTAILPSAVFEPTAALQAVERERATSLYGVPTMFIAELELKDFHKYDLRSLRTGIMAGSPCPMEIMRKVIDHMHIREMTVCYGMTETSPVSFQSHVDDPLDKRVSTVGRIHPHVEVKIVDPDTDEIVPRGQPGELLTKGYSVMLGYWDDETKTKESITPDGWMRTGDMATIGEDDYCRIIGRYKDMLIRGGENVYPLEIEELLYTHPAIKDVQVVGVPDEKFGEEACACVILHDDARASADELRDFCKGKISHFKVPRYVVFVKEYPLTITGKVQKFLLRETAKKILKL